jgi:hypothetical protein
MKLPRPFAVGIGLVAAQVPFIFTGHIQEDAYITFRCATNLAATGVYGYNPGERVSASTSHLSVFAIALVRLVAGAHFIVATQVLYGITTVLGLYRIVTAVDRDRRHHIATWAAIALFPVSLTVAYGGMETPLVVLLTGAILRATYEPQPTRWTLVAFVLLPWVRPDAVALGLIAILAAAVPGRRSARALTTYGISLAAGSIAWLLFNRLYFGQFLPQTVHGKATMWLPATRYDIVVGGASRLGQVFFGDAMRPGLFAPIATKYLLALSVPACLVVVAAAILATARPAPVGAAKPATVALAGVAFAMPTVYALGGAMAPWYFWPSAIAGWLVVVVVAVAAVERQRPRRRRLARFAGAAVMMSLAAGQWLYAASWGTQENLYRAGIGDEIRALASPHDTLLLEPAGYVPYHAQLWTWDEIGVTSPLVTTYRSRFGSRWWVQFVQDVRPSFLLERDHIVAHRTLDGYQLTADERAWFDANYALVRVFRYEPDRLRPPGLMRFAARLGAAREYYLYRRTHPPPR